MYTLYKKTTQVFLAITCLLGAGCKKFVDVDPPIDSVTTEVTFNSETKILAAVRGMYLNMVRTTNFGFGGAMSIGPGVSSDELLCNNTTLGYYELSNNAINPDNDAMQNYWGALYNTIYLTNQAIGNIPASSAIKESAKKQYVAEAKFIRAACYFYLLNLFGDLPLAVSTDYRVNAGLPRSSVSQVYELVLEDLRYAEENLSVTYPGALSYAPRVRANRFAAKALLARVYLYLKDWANAEIKATEVVEARDAAGTLLYSLEPNLNNVFLLNSKEVILHLPQGGTALATWDGYAFVPASATTIPTYQFTDGFLANFPATAPFDGRKTSWMKASTVTSNGQTKVYYAPDKYKLRGGTGTTKTEGLAFLRLAETHLVRAEARAQQNKGDLAIADLDLIRKRAGFTVATPSTTTQTDLLKLIARERSLELFAELGHRWFDLKRRNEADEVLKNKPNWRPEAKLFPIPLKELRANRFLVQNDGYIK